MIKRILKILVGVFFVIKERKSALFTAALIPIIGLLVLNTLEEILGKVGNSWLVWLLNFLLYAFIYTSFAVAVHRIILLGINSVPKWGQFKWSWREISFLLHFAGLTFFGIVLVQILFRGFAFVISELKFSEPPLAIFTLLYYAALMYITGRVSLVFPANSIDHRLSFIGSWRLTREHQLFMVLVVALVPIIYSLAIAVPCLPFLILDQDWVLKIIGPIFGIYLLMVTVASLSLAYLEIQGKDMINNVAALNKIE